MANLGVQKAIALLFLIVIGYLFKRKFHDPVSVSTIRNLILNVALPATIFLSTIEINTQLDLLLLPSFALTVNIYLMLVGFFLAHLLLQKSEKAKQRALILLFPSLAPGLTVYPFIEQFLGKQGLAWAALADTGNKLFVLIGLYALAIYWYQNSGSRDSPVKMPWKSIGLFLLVEPVNIAIVIGLVLAISHVGAEGLPLAFSDAIQKLAACATPLILFYVGISLNLKAFQLSTILMILLARAGVGFLFSAAAIALLHPSSLEAIVLFMTLPQASCSLWPLLHATRINHQDRSASNEIESGEKSAFFDVNFATALLALSFPFSIVVLLVVFSSGNLFHSPTQLGMAGVCLLMFFGVLFAYQQLPVRLRNPIQINIALRNPLLLKTDPSDIYFLNHPAVVFFQSAQSIEAQSNHEVISKEEQLFKKIASLLQKYLHSEINDAEIGLQIQYVLKGKTLIILGQHRESGFIDLKTILGDLEKDIRLLNFDFINQIQLYFRIWGQEKSYIGYSLEFKSKKHDSAAHRI